MIIYLLAWSIVVGLATAWLLILAGKWGIREWLQVHAPNDFLNKLFSCDFCCSWWVGVGFSLTLLLATGQAYMLGIPFCSTIISVRCLR